VPTTITTTCDLTFEDAHEMVCKDYPGITTILTKNFPFCVQGRYEKFLDENFTHSFLIRNPRRVVLSHLKASKDYFMEAFSRGEIGFEKLHDIYIFLRHHLSTDPVIIDADDLLANPEGTMELYCKKVGLTYKKGMTKWESGRGWGPEYQKQIIYNHPVWTESAIKSTGFKELAPLPTLSQNLPIEVVQCIEESYKPYNELYSLRSTAATEYSHESTCH
jgi:hypothetical protein